MSVKNFNDNVPAAPSGATNVKWQKDASGNISASLSGAGAAITQEGGGFFGLCVFLPYAGAVVNDSGDITSGSILAKAFVLPFSITLSSVEIYITTGAVATMDVGLYDADLNLICNMGGIDASITGNRKVTFAPITLQPGLYYIAATGNGAISSVVYASYLEGATLPVLGSYSFFMAAGGGATLPAICPALVLNNSAKYIPLAWFSV